MIRKVRSRRDQRVIWAWLFWLRLRHFLSSVRALCWKLLYRGCVFFNIWSISSLIWELAQLTLMTALSCSRKSLASGPLITPFVQFVQHVHFFHGTETKTCLLVKYKTLGLVTLCCIERKITEILRLKWFEIWKICASPKMSLLHIFLWVFVFFWRSSAD